jgi:hypothetical protein
MQFTCYEASQWARVIEREVIIATSDSDFADILQVFPEFASNVSLRDLAV